MRIAIVGAGVSGLAAAYVLRRQHEVVLFERDGRAGGHASTVLVEDERGEKVPLDVGFIVYSERTYPGFSRLLRELGVETQLSEMSFSLSCEADGFEFSSRGIRGYLANPRNVLRPWYARLLFDLLRFHRDGRRAIGRDDLHDVTFGEYLETRRYSRGFRERLIVPLTASTWSNSPADILEFPMNYLFRFLHQHGVLAPNEVPEWRWIRGGSRAYVQAILATLPPSAVRLDTCVRTIERTDGGASLTLSSGDAEGFDAVIVACHPDEALALLADPSPEEREALGGFRYAQNHVVLHTDERVLPRRAWARASWNYHQLEAGHPETLTMSYDLNRLQRMEGAVHYCVSVNPGDRVDPANVIAEFDYTHPVFSSTALRAQHLLDDLDGDRRTYYAGAYRGYGFHEDGLQSGVRAAARLGVAW